MNSQIKGNKSTNIYKSSLIYYQQLIDMVGIKETNKILKNKFEEQRLKYLYEVMDKVHSFIARRYNIGIYPPVTPEQKKNKNTWFATYIYCHILVNQLSISKDTIGDKIKKSRVQIGRYCNSYEDMSSVPSTGEMYQTIRNIHEQTTAFVNKLLSEKQIVIEK